MLQCSVMLNLQGTLEAVLRPALKASGTSQLSTQSRAHGGRGCCGTAQRPRKACLNSYRHGPQGNSVEVSTASIPCVLPGSVAEYGIFLDATNVANQASFAFLGCIAEGVKSSSFRCVTSRKQVSFNKGSQHAYGPIFTDMQNLVHGTAL